MKINYQYLKDNNLILFEAICGSQAYGTALPTSDKDVKFIYILPKEYIYGLTYIQQIDENKDFVGYEIRRFLELLSVNNPTIIEFIGNYPDDCIIYKHPVFDKILAHRDKFITKQCKDSFAGYARKQISKAEGMNKMQNWEEEDVKRKTPIDFCYVIDNEKSIPLKTMLELRIMDQKFCGLVKVPHTRDTYSLFYDQSAAYAFSEIYPELQRKEYRANLKFMKEVLGFGYSGIEIEGSSKIRLSSIPKGEEPKFNIHYNEDGYSTHCKKYNQYQTWLKARNTTRWTDVQEHGQAIDGKNMLHCRRLLDMAKEIAEGKGINVRRPNVQELLDIRKGKVKLRDLIAHANEEINEINNLFKTSNLPEKVDMNMVHNLLVDIRKEFYDTIKSNH